jgi:hypothetical protein
MMATTPSSSDERWFVTYKRSNLGSRPRKTGITSDKLTTCATTTKFFSRFDLSVVQMKFRAETLFHADRWLAQKRESPIAKETGS